MEEDKKPEITQETEEGAVNVNPWEVSGAVDYEKLITQFGCQRLDPSLIARVGRLTGRPPHVFLRRGIFFAHRFSHFLMYHSSPSAIYLMLCM